jgi:hypothetical protein
MTWDESHPSLKGEYNYARTFPKDFYVIPMLVVSQTQLDKQRVRDVLRSCYPFDERLSRAFKELGL